MWSQKLTMSNKIHTNVNNIEPQINVWLRINIIYLIQIKVSFFEITISL